MPIVDIRFVRPAALAPSLPTARQPADALGRALGSDPGGTWVRLQVLDASQYAENEVSLGHDELPVFVTLLLAHPPEGPALDDQARLVAEAVARCYGMAAERVHVEYAPAGAGRVAFGGKLGA